MTITNFRIVSIEGDKVNIGYGALHFQMHAKMRDNGLPVFLKPSAVYIQEPEYTELIHLVRSEWKRHNNIV